MSTALITPSVLRWARRRARLEPEQLAKQLQVKSEKVIDWEIGEEKPTFRQAQNLANALRIPFGYLFLAQPPLVSLPIPDLRTLGSTPVEDVSPDLHDLLTDVLYKQGWYREYLLEQGAEPLPFVGRFSSRPDAQAIAGNLSATLRLTLADREGVRNWEAFLSLLVLRAEEAGIWVLRSGVVGNNTHRPLDVREMRGFAISDEIAPLVFVNSRDAKSAQIFTLVHELAHLWIGESGISNFGLHTLATSNYHRTERLCNQVAAEVLAPERFLRQRWQADEGLEENSQRLAAFFRVSPVVIARRAADTELIPWEAYQTYYEQQSAAWVEQKKSADGGGSYYRTVPVRNGKPFTEAVLRSALQQRLLLREAGRLLNIQPAQIARLAQEMGIR